MKSKPEKIMYLLIGGLIEAAMFCLYWNVFDTHSAVGLGSVNYWTALGVDYSAACIFMAMGMAWYGGKIYAEEYSLIKESER